MRFRLRTLMIVLALLPPMAAGGYRAYRAIRWATMSQLERNLEEYSRIIDESIRRQEMEAKAKATKSV